MGLQLPSELTEPLSWVGLVWPEADEEKLFEAGQQWIAFGTRLQTLAQTADTAAASVWTTNEGDPVDAFRAWWTRDEGPQRRLAEDAVAAAFAPFGATTAEVPGFIAATRVICRQLIKQAVEHVQTVIADILKKA